MEKLYREAGDKIQFIGVNLGLKESIGRYMKKNNLSFPVSYDEDGKLASLFGARLQENVIIDRNGVIRHKGMGVPKDVDLLIEEILK